MRLSQLSTLLLPFVLTLTLHCGGSPTDDSADGANRGSGAAGSGAGDPGGFDPGGGPPGTGGTSTGAGGSGGGAAEGGAAGAGATPTVSLADVALYINTGDSLAAGYDATGENSPGGKGYARLLVSNHPDYPEYAAANLTAVAGAVDFRDVSESGATSDEILAHLKSKLNKMPPVVDGDVLLTISAGGNDFNDSVWVMITEALTRQVAANLRQNLAEMVRLVRDRYEDPAQGKEVFVVFQTLHDPTGGTGTVPPQFTDGFCSTIQSPALKPFAAMVLKNLQIMNEEIAAEAALQQAFLSDNHALYFDHGMHAPDPERWISGDCTHPNNEGHHQLRRNIWGILTGEWF